MSSIIAPPGLNVEPAIYENFQGLDSSRDLSGLDTGKAQALVQLENGYCDWRGQLIRDPGAAKRAGTWPAVHVRYFGLGLLCWAERTGNAVQFNSDREHEGSPNWPRIANPSSAVFNSKAFFFARALTPWVYNGIIWKPTKSATLTKLKPAYGCAIQRRLAVAGIAGRGTEIHLSRVDNDEVFPDDEDPSSVNVLRAGSIDIRNLLNSADEITGLGAFEQNRLVTFTNDRAVIYRIDPNIDLWSIDDRVNVNLGCISHNTIVSAGTDLLFCSRAGIHSIKRSEDNGITIFSRSLSDRIDILYRALLATVDDPEHVSAVWDQDESQYHVFFPQPGGVLVTRLTLTLPPSPDMAPKWSTAKFLNARCGAFLSGQLVYGTTEGVYDIEKIESEEGVQPSLDFKTPILWHGDMHNTKETYALVIQASGNGLLEIEARDEDNRDLGSYSVEVDDRDDNGLFPDVALRRDYQIKFERRYRGVQFRFRCKGKGLFRMLGFAVLVRDQG